MADSDLFTEYWNQGHRYFEDEEFLSAIAAWRKCLELAPANADLYNNVGLALERIGQTEEAVSHWRQAIDLNPDFYDPYFHLASSHAGATVQKSKKETWKELGEICRRAIELKPLNDEQMAYLLKVQGIIQMSLGQKHSAVCSFEQLLKITPDDQEAYRYLIRLLARIGRIRESYDYMGRLMEMPNFDIRPCRECARRVMLATGVLVLVIGTIVIGRRLSRDNN